MIFNKLSTLTIVISLQLLLSNHSTTAFAPKSSIHPETIIAASSVQRIHYSATTARNTSLRENPNGNNDNNTNNNNNNNNNQKSDSPFDRFWSPRIDDPVMPLTEAGLVQIVGPTLQLFWLVSLDSPYPSWAEPLYDYTFAAQGAFLVPTLIHGAGLACCWLPGCLAARAYEGPNFRVSEGSTGQVVKATLQAGAFACGLLIFATQLDLYRQLGGYVQLGDSPETDLHIYRAGVEVINDIFFAFITLLPWRLFRSAFF